MQDDQSRQDQTQARNSVVQTFARAWGQGEVPELREFLERVPMELRDEALEELIQIDCEQRRRRGETVSVADYWRKFPRSQPTIMANLASFSDTMEEAGIRRDQDGGDVSVDIQIGERLGKYEIRSILGSGGMGVVFAAFDTVIQRPVAIKLLNTKNASSNTALKRLLQEAQTAGALQHPNIVAIHDVIVEGHLFYVVMELVQGDNLATVLAKEQGRGLDWKRATQIVVDCCDALIAAHGHGMIHRDIKPQNIMLSDKGQTKLLDFGLAKSERTANTGLTRLGTILGTPDFMSPEQCNAGSVTSATDIYSLGATYFDLLTGHPPFASDGSYLKVMFAHCNSPVPSASEGRPEIPGACDDIIRKAMAKGPQDRYPSAQEFKADLQSVLVHGTLSQPAAQPARDNAAASRRGRWMMAGSVLTGLLLTAIWFAFSSRPEVPAPTTTIATSESHAVAVPFRGVTDDLIQLGVTAAMNGPSEELGRSIVEGMETYFDYVNDNGGIHGRKINLTALDDRYDPDRALSNMRDLFDERKVFAVIGNVGTPTAAVTSRYASEHGYLFFAPFTGAGLLRDDPPDRYVFNYRASYQQETAALVRYFVEVRGVAPNRIAVFAQNDAYGDDGFNGVIKAMRPLGVPSNELIRVGYNRNQLDIDEAVQTVLGNQDRIDAIVMVPTYKPAARFVKRVREVKSTMLFGMVSYVGSQPLADEFLEQGPQSGAGVIVTQVVPLYSANSTGVLQYRQLLKKYHPECEPGFTSLEGFIAAQLLVEGLRHAGKGLTTESLIDALHQLNEVDLGVGSIMSFSPSDHQASDRVWGTELDEHTTFHQIDLQP
ncbi:MAG: ABC transporter substrate-binding protein [Planctomycetaceae bacterium]